MLFYKYTYTHNGEDIQEKTKTEFNVKVNRTLKSEGYECSKFSEELENIDFYIVNKSEDYITFICVYKGGLKNLHTLDKFADDLILKLNLDMVIVKRVEITSAHFSQELNYSEDNGYIPDAKQVKDKLHLRFNKEAWFKERRFSERRFSKEEMLNKCNEVYVDYELRKEVERIFTKTQNDSFGVPVHYFVNVSNEEQKDKVIDILLNCLKSNNRSIRDYYSVVELTNKSCFFNLTHGEVGKMLDVNMGGVVVLNSYFDIKEDDIFSNEEYISELFIDRIYEFSKEVTSIISCKYKSQEKFFKRRMRDLIIVEINDSTIANAQAKDFLKNYAKGYGVENLDGLCEMIEENIGYKVNDLITIFNKWHKGYIKNFQFPQYANLRECIFEEEERKQNLAINALNEMVGLEKIKQTIDSFINYSKLQKACLENGTVAQNTCKHMCFVGNPGTAKTTVARYVAQVMKENGLLTHGKLIEVGRGDIVSRYVGGTAPKVQDLFKRAMGGVLFIDEAYSLYDGKDGMYGDEAINAIVQEMENKREDVVVIFAGYKNEMERFLDKNSGLKSRIASMIEFPDYTEEELIKIANVQAKRMDIDITQCEDTIKEIVSIGKQKEKNFGNGRFVRNILEKARMQQASRLVKEDKMYGENLRILKPEDFEKPTYQEKINMGFC